MRVLITGGCGFIGSHLTQSKGYTIATLDCMTYAAKGKPAYKVDIRDRKRVREALEDFRPDAILHLAAETHVTTSLTTPLPFLHTNVLGTFDLLETVLNVRRGVRFVHVSTDEVYGDIGGTDETAPMRPGNPYSASKAIGEMVAWQYHKECGMEVMIVRPCNNYGPGQHEEKFIPRSVSRVKQGLPIELHGDGKHSREWIYVTDCCEAILRVMEDGEPGVYNIGTGFELTNEQVARHIQSHLGGEIVYVPDRHLNDRRYGMVSEKIRRLGWEPKVRFEDGIKCVL